MKKLADILAGYMVDNLKMPKDLVYREALLCMSGRRELFIENYKSIIEYGEEKIRLQTKNGKLLVLGKKLQIVYYTSEEMKIKGEIVEIKYE